MNLARTRWVEIKLAFAVLTRLPCGPEPGEQVQIGNAAWAFPLVGIAVGLISGSIYLAATLVLPALPSAILAMIAAILATGALHEDGLADVADGFGGGTSRNDKLRIMRDSQVGSFGVVALVATLGLMASAMATAPAEMRGSPHRRLQPRRDGHSHGSCIPPVQTASGMQPALGWRFWIAIAFAACVALVSAPVLILATALIAALVLLRRSRPETCSDPKGLRMRLLMALGWRFWIAIAFAACVALVSAPVLILATALIAALVLLLAKRQIGGQTGDVLGATQKVCECACWLAVAILVSAP